MTNHNDNPTRSRRRRKRKSYALLILAAGLLAFGVAAGTLYYVLRPTTLRIAVGPAGSDDQKLVQLMAQTFAREGSSVRLAPITTEGTAESIALFTDGKADLAVARGDLNLPANAESVAILRKNVVVLWAPSGLPARGSKKQPTPKIKGIDDLAGHRVGVIGRTQANVTLLRGILKESGINPDKVTISQFATNQIGEMAKDQSIDAFMAVGPLKSKITVDAIAATAAARGEPKFLPIDVADAIAKKNPIYESEEIPASIFGSSPQRPEDKVDTVAVNHLIIAPKSLSDTAVAAFARQLFTNRQQLARELPTASQIEKPDTEKDAALPAHAGAAAYIDGNERTFLEKYTDYIWFAILILSGLGSAGAWFKHYWNRDEHEQYIAHRDHLLELISRARKAETAEELAEMQAAADGMLREAFDCYDDGTVEEGDLSVIALALEQFHHAVADRRAVLAGAGAADAPRMRAG
ncbi:TAXI family TRAP transporter solute-binding subunit [Bradyrhizobium sp. sBnM-33]|uniref:TAXI family TRAP transporter solute-binding subunit n=1 Tax=Bradyrhizobium sp. sBnM-33 TaxID=2831780 RepID=UPI001BCE017A|nr:TAXI family TRAP transporter solute-binding subunit [Bradyrhizobium sp. sBnM-33]WOH49508.1 TAXI family TRAP transporter solute-binding subunit [Bradyrhizobium sp. sBnM-33]